MNTHFSLVNQKLSYAASLLRIDLPELNQRKGLRFQQAAILEATILHLYSAYQFYLRELAENNGVKNPGQITSFRSLRDELAKTQTLSADLMELENLLADSTSWLACALSYYQAIFKSPVKPVEKKTFIKNEALIVLVEETVAEESEQLNSELVKSWLSEFQSLILRQRETGAEY